MKKKIQTLNESTELVISVLPVWLYSHIKNNDFIPVPELNPDFEGILKDFLSKNFNYYSD
jgi:hypothetical protein